MDKARELLATNPEKAATILTGTILKRLDALEAETKFLISKHFRSNKLKGYPGSGFSLETNDFEFAIQYGSVEDIVSAVKNTSVGWDEIKRHYIPMIRKHPNSDKIIQMMKEIHLEHLLKGGKTYRRKLKQRKHTRRQ